MWVLYSSESLQLAGVNLHQWMCILHTILARYYWKWPYRKWPYSLLVHWNRCFLKTTSFRKNHIHKFCQLHESEILQGAWSFLHLKPHCIRCCHFKVDDVSALEAISKPPVSIVVTALATCAMTLVTARMPWRRNVDLLVPAGTSTHLNWIKCGFKIENSRCTSRQSIETRVKINLGWREKNWHSIYNVRTVDNRLFNFSG
jgi:hypothetical protein